MASTPAAKAAAIRAERMLMLVGEDRGSVRLLFIDWTRVVSALSCQETASDGSEGT